MRLIVDTNVLVAASTPEHDLSSVLARRLLGEAAVIVIPLVVLCEYFWVLRSRFRRPREEILVSVEDCSD